jgi:thioredoxin-related protein
MSIRTGIAAAAGFALWAAGAAAAELGDNGLHIQPWFHSSFLEMPEDLAEAAAEGKDLLVIFEQSGCPYCREMHEVNFAREEISAYVQKKYLVVQIDLRGSRDVVDFDGETLSESALARKWLVNFTPTSVFFALDDAANPPSDFREALAFSLPGYFKPFHHMTALEYVASDGYLEEPSFQRWLQERADRLRELGLEVNVWE